MECFKLKRPLTASMSINNRKAPTEAGDFSVSYEGEIVNFSTILNI